MPFVKEEDIKGPAEGSKLILAHPRAVVGVADLVFVNAAVKS